VASKKETPIEAKLQEDEYVFPYHYVTQFKNGKFKQHFVDVWGINYAITLDFVLQRVEDYAPASIVDIGCGDGRLTREIADLECVDRVLGVDFSHRAIDLAKAMNFDKQQANYLSLDITHQRLDEKFDMAVLMEVFEHIPLDQCEEFMGAVRSLLKPGGKLIITVPHANKSVEYKHFQHFTSDTLLKYLDGIFVVESVIPFERRALSRRILDGVLCNSLFVLNNRRILNYIFQYHKKWLFTCSSEKDCQRLYVEAVAV
jgi:2-polyprenyl-3-methyl-5-hydroxy-6-metoxy-1,4-benzoquinol methylase